MSAGIAASVPAARGQLPGDRGTRRWLAGLGQLCLVQEAYRAAAGIDPAAAARLELTTRSAALTAAYHQALAAGRGPLLLAWCRPAAGAPVTVLSTAAPAAASCPAALTFPPGTRGAPVNAAAAADLLDSMAAWVPVGGAADALVPLARPASGQPGLPVRLEDVLLPAWHGPFAWLLSAEPVSAADADELALKLAAAERDARSRSGSPDYAVRAERLARQHQEVRAGPSTGLWEVRLLAGGASAGAASAVAGLLVAGTDPRELPWSLCPLGPAGPLAQALAAKRSGAGGHACPFPAGPGFLAACAHVPAAEIPGVRLTERPDFDVTAEHPAAAHDGRARRDERGTVALGRVLDRDGLPAGELRVSRDTLNRHAFVCGATGSGKSQTVRWLLEALSAGPTPVPWLVIEPAKAEYAGLAGRIGSPVLAIRPGDPNAVPACLNPLEPEPGFPLQTHIDLVRELFQAAFEAAEPFPQVLAHAMDRAYTDLGWDVTLGEPANPGVTPRYPSLAQLRQIALGVVDSIGYGQEIAANVRGFIDVRLGSLTLGTPGRFFDGGHPLDLPALLTRNVVLELEDIGSDQDKAFFIGAVLIRVTEHLRMRASITTKPSGRSPGAGGGIGAAGGSGGAGRTRLRHVTVIEEAHRLLRNVTPGSPAAHAVEMFAGLLAEVRAYGEGIVVAEQIPAKVIPDVVKNSALKVMHRLPAADDRQAVGATMNLQDSQSRYVVTLEPGQAAVFADGMDHPLLAAMPFGGNRESADTVGRVPPTLRSRSAACTGRCAAGDRCTLRQITLAARLAAQPRIVLWAELLTIAHVAGEPAPAPDATWLATLRDSHDPQLLACASGQAIHQSVQDRYAAIAPYYPPDTLAAHLARHAARLLARQPGGCDGSEFRWQAGQYRWIDVHRILWRNQSSPVPHPDTARWRERGLDLPGDTCAQQFERFEQMPQNRTSQSATVHGTASPPWYESAAAALDENPDPMSRLTNAAAYLGIAGDWHARRCYPGAWHHQKESNR